MVGNCHVMTTALWYTRLSIYTKELQGVGGTPLQRGTQTEICQVLTGLNLLVLLASKENQLYYFHVTIDSKVHEYG